MTIKLEALDVFNSINSLNLLAAKPLPVKLSYRLSKLIRKIAKEHELLQEVRNKLVEKYGEERKEGGYQITPDGENWDVYQTEPEELLDEEVELTGMERLPFSEFEKLESINILIEPQVFLSLDWLIVDGEVK